MAAALPEFSVSIGQQRWACVIDPTLALSAFGLPLVARLSQVMDLWVARELWHILDNTHYYLQQPEVLLQADAAGAGFDAHRSEILVNALREWERIRMESDPKHQNCYWIGDGPMESFLPDGLDAQIVWRYEAICADLDRLMQDKGVLASAYRDVASLAVTLPSACVLTHLSAGSDANGRPDMCRVLEQWRIPVARVPPEDPWQREECSFLRQTLAYAGLGKWTWGGLRLAVLHLTAPSAVAAWGFRSGAPDFPEDELPGFEPAGFGVGDYWRGARAFWYPL